MSSQRSSSGQGFRELRARFEPSASDDRNLSPLRGQSPSDNKSSASRSPASRQRVRTSFIAVEPSGHQAQMMASNTGQKHDGSISTAERRSSFSMADNPEAVNELKKTVSNEAERRKSVQDNPIPETAVSSALPTPIPEAQEPASPGLTASAPTARPSARGLPSSSSLKSVAVPETEKQSEHQEKSVSALEDQEAEMRPSDMKSTEAVSEGKADGQPPVPRLDGQTEEGQVEAAMAKGKVTTKPSKPQPPSKPPAPRPSAPTSSRTSSKPIANGTRPTSAAKSTASARTAASASRSRPSTQPQNTSPDSKRTKPVPLPSHLTAPTASSKAKHEPEPSAGRRVTSGSRPLQSSSHLMAPTAASKAKHEPDLSPSSSNGSSTSARPVPSAGAKRDRTSMASTAGPAASRKPAARPSIVGRSTAAPSRQTEVNGSKPLVPTRTAAPGFLERMTKPTAASSSKTHDKAASDENSAAANPAPKPAPGRKPQPNGVNTAGPAKCSAKTAPVKPTTKSVGWKPAMSVQTSSSKSSSKSPASATKTSSPTAPKSQKQQGGHTPNGIHTSSSPSQARKTGKPTTPTKSQAQPPRPPQAPQQTPASSKLDGPIDSHPTEWNAAALPSTPQSPKKNAPFDSSAVPTAELPNGTAATTHETAKKTADMAIRRSMMETPEVEEETIR